MNADYSKSINELVEYLNTCRDQYYNHNNSIISDKQYDDLFDKLKQLEDESGIILSNSPTQSVGYIVVDGLKKSKHLKPLLSLDKTKSCKDVLKFCADKDVLFMLKMDGLTICCNYNNGELLKVETRGDGDIGEDITHNASSILGIPKTIPNLGEDICIVGEAIIISKDFEYINSKLPIDERYATARNLASGSVRQFDSSICASRKVRFITWNADDISEDGTMTSGLDVADKYGFITVPRYSRMHLANMTDEKIEELFNNMKNRAVTLGYPIDGIVIRYNNIKYGESLGVTSHHPRNAIAFKFYDDVYETRLKDIDWTIGKTGVLTPTAIFDPVDIDGTEVTRASLSNLSVMRETLNTAFSGQIIYVCKRNQVIPKVEKSENTGYNLNSKVFTPPKKCPYCGSDTITKTSDKSEFLYCTNDNCSGKLLKKFSTFVSKQAMNIDGLSEKTLEKFIKLGWLKNYSDVYTEIPNHCEELSKMDGFGEKSVSSLIESINNSKHTTLTKLLIALNIDNIGKQNAVELEKFFDSDPQKVLSITPNKLEVSLNNINGFGEIMAKSVADWRRSETEMEEYSKLIQILDFVKPDNNKTTILNGKKFVITGSVKLYKNRDELVSVIESNGGKVQSSVTKETNYLINNDVTSTSGKNKKAKELGIPIISEEDFQKMLGGETVIENRQEKKGLF